MKWFTYFIIFIALLLISPVYVDGHAYLDRSDPVQESELEESPSEIRAQFTEAIDTSVSELRLESEDGEVIEAEPFSDGDRVLGLDIPPLDEGVYMVYWQVLALDTHVTDGQFRFSVGVDLPQGQSGGTIDIGERGESEDDREGRWISFLRFSENLTLMVIGGWFLFRSWLWTKEGDTFLTVASNDRQTERKMYSVGLVVFLCTGSGHILGRAFQLTDSWTDPLFWEIAFVIASSTVIGWVSVIRPLLFGLLLALTLAALAKKTFKTTVFLGLIITFALTGHAYDNSMILSHTVHMAATIVWLAGLLGFTRYSFMLEHHNESLHYMHQRLIVFSKWAFMMVILLAISGVLLSLVYVQSLDNLIHTGYGQTLLWKIGLFSLVLGIAMFHRLVWLPNLQRVRSTEAKKKEMTYLFWGLRAELLLVMIIIVFAAVLSTTSPPEGQDDQGHHHHGLACYNHSTSSCSRLL